MIGQRLSIGIVCLVSQYNFSQSTFHVVNDVTGLNPVNVNAIVQPRSTEAIASLGAQHHGPISIGGGKFSMGGQTAMDSSLHLDMRKYDSVLSFSREQMEITVQSGITWRKLLEYIDPYDLSIRIMQTYANFTVGGSLSVNVHGRYLHEGPIILSVKKFTIVLADGTILEVSPQQHPEIFYGAIGGYGALGIIAEVTLSLTKNTHLKRTDIRMPLKEYKTYFARNVLIDSTVIFHNADLYPNHYRTVRAISYSQTDLTTTNNSRLKDQVQSNGLRRFAYQVISAGNVGKWIRQHAFDPLVYSGNPVTWRNHEATYDVSELEPRSRKFHTYVLQEYFVPTDSLDQFCKDLRSILRSHHVNVLNVSIRFAHRDPGTAMAWARQDVFALVIYYRQGTSTKEQLEVGKWTRELIEASINKGGTYYLPYQLHATRDQFYRAYPGAGRFFALKQQLDPENKFRNKLIEKYR